MFHWSQPTGMASNATKAVISMSTTKNEMVLQKNSKMRNLRNCLILVHVRHLKDCLQHCTLIDSPIENAYIRWEFFRRQEIGLKERDIERSLVT
ncbi:hypothetical protein Trydic_g13964 [Trypoxylus dichotomus]